MKSSKNQEYKKVLRAVEDGNNEAKTRLAWFLLSGCGGAEVDEDKAFKLLEERVKEKDAEALWMFGLCYEYGMGCKQDFQKAFSLYESACEENSVASLLQNRAKGYEEVRFSNTAIDIIGRLVSIAPWTSLNLSGVRK